MFCGGTGSFWTTIPSAFGGGGFGGGDPNIVNGKRINYGSPSQVKITFQPNALLTVEMIERLLFSDRIWHAAILDIGGKPNPKDPNGAPVLIIDGEIVRISPIWGGSSLRTDELIEHGVVFVQLGAGVSRTKADLEKLDEAAALAKYEPITKKYFSALSKRIEKELTAIMRRQFDKEIERQRKSVSQEIAPADEAGASVDKKREELRRLESGVPKQVLAESVSNLLKQQQEFELDLVGMKGREDALKVEVAKIADRVKSGSVDDEVVRNLKRVIELRAQQLKRLRQLVENGTVSIEDIGKAEEQVALAEVELAQAKRGTSRSATEQLDKLNADLTQLAISKAEAESKLEFIKGQLDHYSKLLREETQTVQPVR